MLTTRYVLIAILGLMAVAAAAQEPPPPLIEPELAPGSRLVEARVDELVRRMSDRLARAASVTLEATEVYDEVPEHSPRRQLTNRRHVAFRRPDRLAGDAAGDAVHRSFWYDGKTLSVLDKQHYIGLLRAFDVHRDVTDLAAFVGVEQFDTQEP